MGARTHIGPCRNSLVHDGKHAAERIETHGPQLTGLDDIVDADLYGVEECTTVFGWYEIGVVLRSHGGNGTQFGKCQRGPCNAVAPVQASEKLEALSAGADVKKCSRARVEAVQDLGHQHWRRQVVERIDRRRRVFQ